ncbi:MAG: TonB-dependent receptor [Mucilaginibacter polytrichastri]|nr:TonB-dependent receptor [Mucilaginibacter polytrichastri]
MRNISFLTLTLFLSLFGFAAFAQAPAGTGSIKGRVIDSATKKPLDFVTISLKDDKKNALKTALTDVAGNFVIGKLAAGKYEVDVVSIGYKGTTVPVTVTEGGTSDLGSISIGATSQQLKEVSVVAVKPLVTQEVDRIAYDVQADPESKSLTALDLMRKVPLLSVDAEDNIKMKGSGDYKILINGKPSSMVARNPSDVFKTMPASSIQKIEVITTPPAKYDAEGIAGIINIITNKNADNGFNGNVSVRARFPAGGPGGGANITFKQGKFGLSSYMGYGNFNQPRTINTSDRFAQGAVPTALFQTGNNESHGNYSYLGTELSFEIDTLNLITAEFNPNLGRFNNDQQQVSRLLDAQNQLQQGYSLFNDMRSTWKGIDLGVNYQLGFKSNKDRLLTFSYKYSNSGEDSRNNLRVRDAVDYPVPDYMQFNDQAQIEQTIQADYVHPLKKVKIEGGVKAILRDNKSDFEFNTYDAGGAPVLDPARSNNYTNNQDIYGVYNTYQYSIKSWSFKAGARLEYTVVNADFISQEAKLDRNYSNLIPSISINRKFKDMSSVNVGFTQRIQRPGIWNLNPFVDRANPNFISTGNPDLNPVLNNNVEFGYSKFKKGSINLSMSYSFANNTIQQVSSFDPATQITTSSYQNIGKDKSLGGNINVNYPLNKDWNLTLGGRMNYVWIQGVVDGVIAKNEGFNGYLFGNTSYKLKGDWRLGAQFSYSSPFIRLQGQSNAWIYSSLSLAKDVIKDKLTISGYVNNPYAKYYDFRNSTSGLNFNQSSLSQTYYRNFSFSASYKFGRLKGSIKKNERGINNDDSTGGGGAKTGGS